MEADVALILPVHQLSGAFGKSAIIGDVHDSLIPSLMALPGPLLPADIRAF